MTNYEFIHSLTPEQMAKYFDNVFGEYEYDGVAWGKWFSDTYCANCEPEMSSFGERMPKQECAYCEINNNCRFFDHYPDYKESIMLWLNAECEENIDEYSN